VHSGPNFGAQIKEGLLKAKERFCEGKPLLGRGFGIVGDNDCPHFSPVFAGSSMGNKPVSLPAKRKYIL
jgi:hypothetical protein